MGMFDYVDYETKCPKCGETVSGFQTKSGRCQLETITPEEAGVFYSSCKGCDSWIDCRFIYPEEGWVDVKLKEVG